MGYNYNYYHSSIPYEPKVDKSKTLNALRTMKKQQGTEASLRKWKIAILKQHIEQPKIQNVVFPGQ